MRFHLRTALHLMACASILCGWWSLIRYSNQCSTIRGPAFMIEDRELSGREHTYLRAPDGELYQRPYDPVSIVCFILCVLSVGLAAMPWTPRPSRSASGQP